MMAWPPVVLLTPWRCFSRDGEPDTQPLIDQLWRAGKRVYLRCCIRLALVTCCFYALPSAERTDSESPEDP